MYEVGSSFVHEVAATGGEYLKMQGLRDHEHSKEVEIPPLSHLNALSRFAEANKESVIEILIDG